MPILEPAVDQNVHHPEAALHEKSNDALSGLAIEAWSEIKAHPYLATAAAVGLTLGLAKGLPSIVRFAASESLSTEENLSTKLIGRLTKHAVVATDDDLRIVGAQRASVRHLSFSSTGSVSDEGMRSISGLKSLKTLAIDNSHITDRGVGLAKLDELQGLQTFTARNSMVGDETVRMLAARGSRLNLIDLREAGGLTRNSWKDLCNMRPAKLLINNGDSLDTLPNESLRKYAYENYIDRTPLNNARARFDAWQVPASFRINAVHL